jgi:hypothetical protein
VPPTAVIGRSVKDALGVLQDATRLHHSLQPCDESRYCIGTGPSISLAAHCYGQPLQSVLIDFKWSGTSSALIWGFRSVISCRDVDQIGIYRCVSPYRAWSVLCCVVDKPKDLVWPPYPVNSTPSSAWPGPPAVSARRRVHRAGPAILPSFNTSPSPHSSSNLYSQLIFSASLLWNRTTPLISSCFFTILTAGSRQENDALQQ